MAEFKHKARIFHPDKNPVDPNASTVLCVTKILFQNTITLITYIRSHCSLSLHRQVLSFSEC